MGHSVTLDHQPHAATVNVMPSLGLYATNVFAQEYRLMPFVGGRIQGRVFNGAVTTIAKFAVVTFTTKGAIYAYHFFFRLTMQLGVRPRTAFVDNHPTFKTLNVEVSDDRVRAIIGDQIGKIPTGCRTRLKPAIVPTCIEIKIV